MRGMHQERIQSTSSWYSGSPRHDCVFVGNANSPDALGFKSLLVAHVFLFFSFKYINTRYPCALVHWFLPLSDAPNDETGMWMVQPDYLAHRKRFLEVIHLDTILRGAHLIGVPGGNFLPSYPKIDCTISLDLFKSFMLTNMLIIMHMRLHSNTFLSLHTNLNNVSTQEAWEAAKASTGLWKVFRRRGKISRRDKKGKEPRRRRKRGCDFPDVVKVVQCKL